jgi:hypothetical protein
VRGVASEPGAFLPKAARQPALELNDRTPIDARDVSHILGSSCRHQLPKARHVGLGVEPSTNLKSSSSSAPGQREHGTDEVSAEAEAPEVRRLPLERCRASRGADQLHAQPTNNGFGKPVTTDREQSARTINSPRAIGPRSRKSRVPRRSLRSDCAGSTSGPQGFRPHSWYGSCVGGRHDQQRWYGRIVSGSSFSLIW